MDGAFVYVATMYIRRYKLESAFPIFNDGATILGSGLVVEDLEINAVAFGIKARNDAVLGSNVGAILV